MTINLKLKIKMNKKRHLPGMPETNFKIIKFNNMLFKIN